MNAIEGIIVAVIAGLLISYFKRSRLRVKISPRKRWLFEDIYSPDINARITNIGYIKTEVCGAHLELRHGSNVEIIKDVMHYKTIESLEPKSTIDYTINCDEKLKTYDFRNYPLIRVKIFTTNDRVYRSNWLSTDDVLRIWE